jgi:hypothetical protein
MFDNVLGGPSMARTLEVAEDVSELFIPCQMGPPKLIALEEEANHEIEL